MSRNRYSIPWLLLIQSAAVQFTLFTMRPALAYRALELNIEASLLGLVAASYAIAPMLIAISIGRATDRGFLKPALLLGSMGMLLTTLGFLFWSGSFTLILLWGIVLGISQILGVTAQQTLIAASGDEQLDTAFGFYTFSGSIGQSLGPIMIVLLGGNGHFMNSTLVGIGAVVTAILLMVVTLALILRPTAAGGPRPEKLVTPREPLFAVFRAHGVNRSRLYGTIVISLALLAMIDVVALYLPAWGVEREISVSTIGILLTIRSLAMMASRLFLGVLARRFGRSRLLIWSTLIAGAAVMVLIFQVPVWIAALSMLISGLFLGFGQPLTMAIVSQEAPPRTRGTWLSVRLAGNSAGQLTIPVILGTSAALIGAGGVLFLSGVGLALIGVGSGYLFRGDDPDNTAFTTAAPDTPEP